MVDRGRALRRTETTRQPLRPRGIHARTFDEEEERRADDALAVVTAARSLSLELRAGVHTGEMQTIDGKAGGIAVAAGAGPGEVLTTSTVKDLVAGSGLTFEDAGQHELKGLPDRWHLYRVLGRDP